MKILSFKVLLLLLTLLFSTHLLFLFMCIVVVGHSIADCFLTHDDPKTLSDCPNGLIRPAKDLSAFCVDAGMYAGGRGFLQITKDGHFITYEKYGGQKKITDYTHKVCSKACSVNEL